MLTNILYGKTLVALQELLLEELARRANVQMQSQHRSTLQYKDVGESWSRQSKDFYHLTLILVIQTSFFCVSTATVVHDWKALLFLSGMIVILKYSLKACPNAASCMVRVLPTRLHCHASWSDALRQCAGSMQTLSHNQWLSQHC